MEEVPKSAQAGGRELTALFVAASLWRGDRSGTPRRLPQQGGTLLTPCQGTQGTAEPLSSNRTPFPGQRPSDSVLKEGTVPLLLGSLPPVAKQLDMVVSHLEPQASETPQGWAKRSLGS